MCGIAGFVGNISSEQATSDLLKMSQGLHHRGPDKQNNLFFENLGVGFAHTRLSIIDLSEAGDQPMTSAGGRFAITFNGEIYNFRKMRKELEGQSVSLKGNSDTEVFLNYIECFGLDKALEKACGMFAFALLDKKESIAIPLH